MGAWPWILLLALISLFGGIVSGWALLQHLSYVLIALDLLALLTVLASGHGLTATSRTSRTRVTSGDEIEEIYEVEKRGFWPVGWAELDALDGSPTTSLTFSVPKERSQLVIRRRRLEERGWHHAAVGDLRVRDPLGLIVLTRLRLDPVAVIVYPRPILAKDAVAAIGLLGRSRTLQSHRQDDASVGDLRPFQEGDSLSRIHWRSTARRGHLMVSEPEREPSREVRLLIDLGGAQAERAAGVATYLVDSLLRAGKTVSAAIAGRDNRLITADHGRAQAGRLLEALAAIEPSSVPRLRFLIDDIQHTNPCEALLVVTAEQVSEADRRRLAQVAPLVRIVRLDEAEAA